MLKSWVPWAVVATLLVVDSTSTLAQERLQGKVVATKLTHCDFKPGGCAGTLTLEVAARGQGMQSTIDVPLGTVIRKGSETVYLPALRGRDITVVLASHQGALVAKSIDVVSDKP